MAENPSLGHEAIAAAAGIVPGLIARLTSGGADANVPPELRQLLAQSVQRQQYQNPLFQAVSNQAFQGLPSYARQGLSMPSGMPAPSPQSDGGGMPDWLKMAMAGAGGAAANGLGGGNALGALINGLKRLFGGGGRGEVQGNKPNAGGALTGPGAFDPSQFMGWDQGPSGRDGGQWDPFLPSDPGVYTGWEGLPSDPSGGTGIGPGMQGYYGGGFYGPGDPREE
jgi:hypothetical protein